MKPLAIIFVLIFCLAGCKDDSPMPPKDERNEPADAIKGLELTYLPVNIRDHFNAVYFVNETHGFVAGFNGVMYKTEDGGKSWEELHSNTTLTINELYFLNNNEGFAVGGESTCVGMGCIPAGALIIHTKDGGKTWRKASISASDRIDLRSICFAGDSLGFAVGNGTILTTKDRGTSWKQIKIEGFEGIMRDVEFFNEKIGLISCNAGQLLKTIDGGLSWSISSPFRTSGAYTLSLMDENTIFSASNLTIEKTSDFGNTWSYLQSYPADIDKIVFKSENIGYAFGHGNYSGGDFGHYYGAIYYTVDGGATWQGSRELKEIRGILSASFPTESLGYAVSRNMLIKVRKR